MIQSIIIFAVILLLKAVLTAVAKQQEAKKKAERAGQSAHQQKKPSVQSAPRESSVMQAWVDARIERTKAPTLESASTADMKADARRRGHLHEQTPIKAATLHASEGESTFDQLARTVAAIHSGILTHRRGEHAAPIAAPSVAPSVVVQPRAPSTEKGHAKSGKRRFHARQAVTAFEILSPPVSMR